MEELKVDIFTTQLTRVVPVPIKPTSLKVKALVKNTAMSALSQDDERLEDDEYYSSRVFAKKSSQEKQSSENAPHDNHADAPIETQAAIDVEDAIEEETAEHVKLKQPKVEAVKALDETYDNILTDKKSVKIDSEKTNIESSDKENDKGNSKHLDLYA